MNNKELVFKTLKESDIALRAGEIANKSEIDKKEVDKVMKQLKDEGRIVSPKRCFWKAI